MSVPPRTSSVSNAKDHVIVSASLYFFVYYSFVLCVLLHTCHGQTYQERMTNAQVRVHTYAGTHMVRTHAHPMHIYSQNAYHRRWLQYKTLLCWYKSVVTDKAELARRQVEVCDMFVYLLCFRACVCVVLCTCVYTHTFMHA